MKSKKIEALKAATKGNMYLEDLVACYEKGDITIRGMVSEMAYERRRARMLRENDFLKVTQEFYRILNH